MKGQGSGRRRGWGLRAVIAVRFFTLAFAVSGEGTVAAASKERPIINIVTSSYAQISDRTLEEAEAAATRVLSIADIETRWRQCQGSEARSNAGPTPCRFETGATLFLLIIPRAMAAHWASRTTSLGLAIIPGRGKKGDMAYVFYHRVEELAATGEASAGEILGHAMAHEVGHLLLNSNTHSDVGIMQPEWRDGQMGLLRSGRLLFTDIQARHMRAAVVVSERETGIVQAENTSLHPQ